MSYKYDEYLYDHRMGVRKAYNWLIEHNIILPCLNEEALLTHDYSKNSTEEYKAYDDYFYGNKSYNVVKAFNYAWLHHIHNNPHHWQYWVLQHDDEPEEILEMPDNYIVEMICDWWSFSWKSGNLYELFDWYEKHKDMKLAPNTRKRVENILEQIKMELDKENGDNYLEHHGVEGQKWGVKNGPPYPLNSEKIAERIYSEANKKEANVTKDIKDASEKSGSNLHGLEHKLKTKESIKRKIETDSEEKGITISEAAKSLKDALRYTTISEDDSFVQNYNAFKKNMEDKGYKEIRCRNYFDLYNRGFVKHKSVQSVFEDPNGYSFEVQFQTPSSQKAKDLKLPIYEERRKPGLSKERQKVLEKEMEKLAEDVSVPKYIESIKSH